MPEIKIGIALATLRQSVKSALVAARKLGASGIEIDAQQEFRARDFSRTAARQLLKMLDDLGLRVAALRFVTRRGYDVEEGLERRIEATRQTMRMARELGANVVVNRVPVPDRNLEPRRWQLLCEVLTDLGREGQRSGVFLAAITGADVLRLAELIEALPMASLAVDLDPAELIAFGQSPAAAVDRVGPHIVHVHASDATRDSAVGGAIECQLGRGLADFPHLVGALSEHDYRGYFTIRRERCTDPEREIGQAVTYLRSL